MNLAVVLSGDEDNQKGTNKAGERIFNQTFICPARGFHFLVSPFFVSISYCDFNRHTKCIRLGEFSFDLASHM